MIKLPIVLVAGVLLATPVLAQDKRDHGVLRETPLVTSGQGIERAIALCDQHIVQDLTLVNCPNSKLCNAHYAWPECYEIIDAYQPTAKRLQGQEAAEKAAQDETDHVFVQGIAKALKCTPAPCAGTSPPPHSGDVGLGTYSTTSGNITGTSTVQPVTSIDIGGTASPPVSPFVPHGDKRNADDLRRAYGYCEQYLHVQFCDMTCTSTPEYADRDCDVIRSLWLSSDWKKQDDARDKKAKADEVEHAKAFVAGVMRQKP